jgi:L-amino acid N-acyltransferase YncA
MNAVLEERRLAFERERMDDVFAEIQPLLKLHFAEIAHYADIPLDPDYRRYRRMEEAGALRVFTVRVLGALKGYAIFCVAPSLHYQGSLQAVQDILYLDPEEREGRLGLKLIQYADGELKAEGVQVVVQHIKAAHDFSPILKRLGYELQDYLYTKRLDR